MEDTTRTEILQATAINTLLSTLIDSPPNQKAFEAVQGYDKVAAILKKTTSGAKVRGACAEFALYSIKYFKANEVFEKTLGEDNVKKLLKASPSQLVEALDSK
eukprot:TRINITY_DN9271_c0_g2_i1.p1 TRINITY_DN9271_c0_g2~~TRINITY_DN9271_c0_g2_i1.p1  ORF type:complete len:110 (-),score=24.49 TRINITY_DN9271_c0_g2_i1:59-367(-)